MEEGTAEKYLLIVRYLQSLSRRDRTRLLSDPTLTISSLLMKVTFSTRSGMWADPGELATSAALLQQIVPVRDLRRCYKLGRSLRETAYDIWIQNEDSLSPQEDYNVLIVRQFSCIKHDCTYEQAQRYCMLVRYIEHLPGNPRVISAWRKSTRGCCRRERVSWASTAARIPASRCPELGTRPSSPSPWQRTPSSTGT